MNTHEEITITITLNWGDDPICEVSQTLEPEEERYACWAMCENPRCYQYGCLNAQHQQDKGVQS